MESNGMQEERKTKVDPHQELATLHRGVSGLKQAAEQWSKTFDTTSDLVFVQDKDFRFVKVNKSVCDLLKVKPEDLIGKKCYEVLHKSDKPWPNCPLSKALKDKRPHTKEVYDPNIGISLLITAFPLFDGNGELTSVVHIATDITERKRMEEVLLISAQQYRDVFTCATDAIFILDSENHIVDANPEACKMFGYSSEEMIGLAAHKLVHPDYRRKPEEFRNAFEPTGQTHFEAVNLRKDGTPFYVEVRGTIVTHNGNEHFLLTVRDITVRKKAEEALQKSEEQHKTIFHGAVDGIIYADRKGNVIEVNPAFTAITGIPREEVIGKNATSLAKKFAKPKDLQHLLRAISQLLRGAPIELYELEINDKIVEISTPVLNMEAAGITGIIRDITKRKKAEETVRKSENKYRKLFEETTDVIFVADAETGIITDCNRAAAQLVGREKSELIGKHQRILHPPEEIEGEFSMTFKQHVKEKEGQVLEAQVITKEGQIKDVEIRAVRFELEGEERIQAIFRDITERKQLEDTLRESEEKYRTLVESAAEYIAIVNEDGVFSFISETGATRLGGKPADYVGKTMWDLFPKKTADQQAASVRKVMNTGEGMNVVVLTELQGRPRWHNTTVEPLRDGNGKATAAMIVSRDIHELRQAEEQVRKLSSTVEQSIDGIAIGDLEPKLLYVNDAFARMHGYSPEEMIGIAVTKLHNKEQMSEYKKGIKQIKTQGSWQGEIGHIRKDGTPFHTYTSATLLNNNEGKPTGILAVARDITEDKRRAEELSNYRENMVQVEELAAVGTLSATLAHELTQPLTVIRLSIENSLAELETMSCPGTVVEDLKEGLSELSSMTSMVDRFRKFAKMSTETTVSEVDLKAVADRIVKSLDESAWRAKVTLQLEGMDKLPLIYSQERELEQIFFSLVENAIQAADGKKKRQVIIRGAVREEHIELQFSDNCGGIAPKNLDKIFKPFFTTKHADERTGLGLCVVEHIVSQGGGKVRVESKLGKGSTFFVTLPINKGRR
jgi:PAS domain S-box-containing protein